MRLLYVILGILLFFLVIGVIVWLVVRKTKPGLSCKRDTLKWDPTCLWMQELKSDSSIQQPQNPLYLVKFSYSENSGPPVCLPMWYAYRYVKADTGEYGPLSQWTTSPVSAGGQNLPLPPNCSISDDTCTFNNPVIGVVDKLEYPLLTSGIWANVHRYVGKMNQSQSPDSDTMEKNSTIIGTLLPFSAGCNATYAWSDVLDNPCVNTNCGVRCTNCD